MNKRGATSLAVFVLVIGTLVLIAFSLFVFMTEKGKIKESFVDIGYVEQVYADENEVYFYFEQVADEAALAAYDKQEDLVNFDNRFLTEFKNNFAIVSGESYVYQIKTKLDSNEYELKTENNVLVFTIKTMLFTAYDKSSMTDAKKPIVKKVEYTTDLQYKLNLEDFEKGLKTENE